MLHPNDPKALKGIVSSNASQSQISEIKAQFEMLNSSITSAISKNDFARVVALDSARQEILRDICLRAPSVFDDDFFIFMEKCARENSLLISKVEDEMDNLTCLTGKTMKMRMAYKR